MANSFEELFGYNPIEEFHEIAEWRTDRRSAIAPLVDAQIGYMATLEENKANAQLAKAQNQFNLDMWNKQNEYNSPKATMQRLVEAGINPRAYNQIGQFANASQPHQAVSYNYKSPMSNLAKFAEKSQIDLALRSQKLERIKLSKDIALESADKIRAYRELDETKRHNVANEKIAGFRVSESERHNMAVEAIDNISYMMRDSEFRLALAKAGITRNTDGTFNIPAEDIRINEKYRQELINNLKKSGLKLDTEKDYLQQKKELEQINTGVKWLDSFARVLSILL